MVQGFKIYPPVRGTRVRSLVVEDAPCLGATKPVCHNCEACVLEPGNHTLSPHATAPEACMPFHAHVLKQEKSREVTEMKSPNITTKE